MVQKGKVTSRKLPVAPLAAKSSKAVKKHPLFEKRTRNNQIGGAIKPKTDLTRYVRWPRYIRMQRQKKILLERLKVPPALNQFNHPIDKNQSNQLFRLMAKYKPETKLEKRQRLQAMAEKREKNVPEASKKPVLLKYGLNHVTDLVELKKARLVVIANDVNPIELVCWLPALCRMKDIPYCIVRGKSRLGQMVHKKTASCVVMENVRKEDQVEFDLLVKTFQAEFNDNSDLRRKWGGGMLGLKSRHAAEKKAKLVAKEQLKKLGK